MDGAEALGLRQRVDERADLFDACALAPGACSAVDAVACRRCIWLVDEVWNSLRQLEGDTVSRSPARRGGKRLIEAEAGLRHGADHQVERVGVADFSSSCADAPSVLAVQDDAPAGSSPWRCGEERCRRSTTLVMLLRRREQHDRQEHRHEHDRQRDAHAVEDLQRATRSCSRRAAACWRWRLRWRRRSLFSARAPSREATLRVDSVAPASTVHPSSYTSPSRPSAAIVSSFRRRSSGVMAG